MTAMDHDELAAKAAVACWRGMEGTLSREIHNAICWPMMSMERWLSVWMLARSVPKTKREGLLDYLNAVAIPRFKGLADEPSRKTYSVVEQLSQEVLDLKILKGRPTSLLSKLGLAVRPELFIPYDSRVFAALKMGGCRMQVHAYADYMSAVISKKPDFVEALNAKNLTVKSLNSDGLMTQPLFELRALDKRLMLEGGFNPIRMARDLN